MNKDCLVIAEAGVNHNGRLDLALKLVDVAADANADIVKFQTFNTDLLVSQHAITAQYQQNQTGLTSQQILLKNLELPLEDYVKIFSHAKSHGLKCLSTPFDIESLNYLVDLGMDIIKIPSGEITNGPLLLAVAQKKLPMILSTGMSTLDEIERALAVLTFGYDHVQAPTDFNEIWNYWQHVEGSHLPLTILHCTTNYPAAFDEINLNAMTTIAERFQYPVGYSDHSLGILVPIIATSMGASVIEKHITLDKSMPGPDHACSLEPDELKEMVEAIRNVSTIRGSYNKGPTMAEQANIRNVRRGVYLANNVDKGAPLSGNLITLRPENAHSPMDFWNLSSGISSKFYNKSDPL